MKLVLPKSKLDFEAPPPAMAKVSHHKSGVVTHCSAIETLERVGPNIRSAITKWKTGDESGDTIKMLFELRHNPRMMHVASLLQSR